MLRSGNPTSMIRPLKRAIVRQVREIFNDTARGERPVMRQPDGLFGPNAVAWRVHGDVTTMMIGGVAALLLQMLHPAVLAGVWDHSNFREDMLGRLRRTARFIALTTYGGRDEAGAAIARVKAIHGRVSGTLADGRRYEADDPRLLAYVHVTEALSFLDAWRRYAEPAIALSAQDRYFAEVAQIGEALGADRLPRSRAHAIALLESYRGELVADARSREVAALVLNQRASSLALEPFQAITVQASIDLLPDWARAMHGLAGPGIATPLVRAGGRAIAGTLRWAFR